MKKALVLIDIQNDYFPGGKMELFQSLKASQNAQKILNKFRANQDLIVHVQHLSTREDASFFIPNSEGVKLHENVAREGGERVIIKHFPNSFRETDLLDYLKEQKVEELVVVGMMTHMCVDATVRAAKDFGFNIQLIGDACATKDLEWNNQKLSAVHVQQSFLAALNYFYASVWNTDDYLKEL